MGPHLLEVAVLTRKDIEDGSRQGYAPYEVEAKQHNRLFYRINLSWISKKCGISHRDHAGGECLIVPYDLGDIFNRGVVLIERLDKLILDNSKTRQIRQLKDFFLHRKRMFGSCVHIILAFPFIIPPRCFLLSTNQTNIIFYTISIQKISL